MGIVIGVIIVLAVAAFLAVLTCKSKNSDLFKWIGIAIFIAFCFTWVIPYGYFQEGTFYEYAMKRIGLNDIPTILYYGVYFCLTTIIYLLTLGGFYGVISKTKSYQALVKRFAKSIKGREVLTAIIMIVSFVVLTSILKTPFVLLAFVPFLISVLLNAKFDKITAMGLTFGSILVGTLAATYGTDGLYWWNSYLSVTDVTVGMTHRVIIGGIALILFIIFNVLRIVKYKKNRSAELEADLYPVEEVKGNVKVWPSIVVFSFLFVIVILGYVGWETSFGIDCFTKFHTWLTDLAIGDFEIFSHILGSNATALGAYELSSLITILLIVTLVIKLMNGIKGAEFAESFSEGIIKMVKPVCLFVLTYVLFIISYMSPFMAYITEWAFSLTDKFNPFITAITAFVTSIFHADLGYSAYIVGTAITKGYAANFDLVHTLYVSTYGLVQLFIPTSGILLLGLSYLKIDYKSWFKYIWKFFVAMVVVVLVLATIVTYA
ncbi:MAG: hypothetical protein IJO63_03205 [Bacilli bacterium]|nr:hypothetical protein [Bacilli bacterium]